jgi:hypothetical protein
MQSIHYRGQLVAVITGDRAIITPSLKGRRLVDVQAMCLYAISCLTAKPARRYSDEAAFAYARRAHAERLLRRATRRSRN